VVDDSWVHEPDALTPWENHDGMWYKREDYHRNRYGVNGAKYRLCRHLIATAVDASDLEIDHVVTAQSVRSPQAAIVATLCEEMDLGCTVVVGASKPETAIKHRSIEIAVQAGAMLDTSRKVAYNGVIQPYAKSLSESLGAYQVPYAISPPENASEEVLQACLEVGGRQAANIPEELRTLVVAFGSGNTTAGILYGLSRFALHNLERVVLVGVGPDRTAWLHDRLDAAGASEIFNEIQIDHQPLHGWFAEYADLMPETIDGIVMHPTYEGKVVRYLNSAKPEWWTARDGSTGFWIVGGPM
jgi:1-aminocyclopropane-1-carboxylate deaminase/D-cysteine desulfhydrase-like pyridoxal-dependent ACC family enzyme